MAYSNEIGHRGKYMAKNMEQPDWGSLQKIKAKCSANCSQVVLCSYGEQGSQSSWSR